MAEIRFAPGLVPVLKHGNHNQKDHAGKGRVRSDDEIADLAQQRAGLGKTLDKSVIGEDGYGYVYTNTGERFDTHHTNPTGAARVIAEQGWDAPAQSVDQETFDRLAQRDDLVTVYRGGPAGLERGMIEGTPYIGDGKIGPGTYVSTERDRAASFAQKWVKTGVDEAGWPVHDIYGGDVVPMLMPVSMFGGAPEGQRTIAFDPITDHGLNGVGAVSGFRSSDRIVWNTGAMIVGPPAPVSPGVQDFAGRWSLDDVSKSLNEPPTDGETIFYRIANGEATLLTDSGGAESSVIKFAPGLTPVIKYNPRQPRAKDGRWTKGGAAWGGQFIGSPFEETPSEADYREQMANIDYIMGRSPFPPDYSYEGIAPNYVTVRQVVREQKTKIRRKIKAWKEARERRYLENLSPEQEAKLIAANRARVDAKRAAQGLPPVVYKAMDPVLPLLYDVFRDVVDDPFVWLALIQDERPLSQIDGDVGDILDDMLDAVAPAETVIKFAPGLRPVLKHGSHNQKDHAGKSGAESGSPKLTIVGKYNGPNKSFNERTRVVRYKGDDGNSVDYVLHTREELGTRSVIANRLSSTNAILERVGHLDAVGPGPNAWKPSASDKGTITEVKVESSQRRRGLASAMLRFHRDTYPEWDVQHSDALLPDGEAWAEVVKHLSGKHDQKTHGRGGGMSGPDSAPGGGQFSAWGDREGELRVAARMGPSREMLDNALYPEAIEVDPAEIRSRIADSYDYEIEMEVERQMARTIGLETDEEVEWQRERYYEEELNTRVELYGESTAETIRAENLANDWETPEAIDSMNEVYGTSHTGVNSEGIEVTIQAQVDSIYAPKFDGDVLQVEGTLMNEDGFSVGRFTRQFKQDGEGGVKVSHELLEIDDEEYQGAGFSKVFNRNAENYYISHGIDRIDVHAALDGGGYTWASSGFDFDTNPNNLAKSRNNLNFRMDQYEENFNVPRVVRNQMDDLRSRIQLDPSNEDFPTPKEFADIGRLPGAESWPGKVMMRGSNWYGTKILRPEGARKSRTQEWNEAREAAAEANRERFVQLTLPGT